ncbi:ATPase, T2SS/T4P/T4SS family [Kineosporia succinea]|uniref:Type IV pilus assembly protein PilB n=1 Tax=Kineosporia succinea TaxID=84632 RepID=A0ABT9NYF6_9ACTN|nr:ATPase, T2SS/T4P/T4SS family [Kineosporia succinea]MDP9825472.1 type IV pilus assembly protein PilB [Kineosporia succinea]
MTTTPQGTGIQPGPPAQPGPSPQPGRRRLGDVLVESGLLTPDQLEQALNDQRRPDAPRRRLGQVVSDLGLATERDVAEALAKLLGLQIVDLSRTMPAPDVVRLLPRAVAERTRVLVLDRTSKGLLVAAADPTNVLALDDVKLYTRSADITVMVATDSQIRDQLARAWSLGSDSAAVSMAEESVEEEDSDLATMGTADDDAPIVKLVNRIFGDAVRLRASDIHVEVQREVLRVRYRIDGLLRDVMNAPRRIATSVISRIKIMSGLDISERRIPQDGRTRIVVENMAIDCRISTLPSLHGEKVVIRLLTRGDEVPTLSQLGFEPDQLENFEKSLAVPQGLVLITGPTGSGKTNTLYSAIAQISDPEKNIVTLEDPVEVQLPGITQVGANAKIGMTFAAGLRSILRQDPDIILVGEVRDEETAELALTASITGHLVLTTLHTNSAVAALTRLVDMGVEPFLVASSLTCAIAQRLVRVPCPSCKAPYTPGPDTLTLLGLLPSDLEGATPMKGTGCPECGGTGYKGRTAVYEVLVVDNTMRQVLMKDASEAAIAAAARQAGMSTLRLSGLTKARQGKTTYEEVIRVTQSDTEEVHSCPKCGRHVSEDMVACPYCATNLDRGHCQNCGKALEEDWNVCPYCRTAVTPP